MSVFAKMFEARRRRLAIHDLRRMSPEILMDIGIEPDQIETAVSAAIEGKRAQKPSVRSAPHHGARGPSNGGAWPYPWRHAG